MLKEWAIPTTDNTKQLELASISGQRSIMTLTTLGIRHIMNIVYKNARRHHPSSAPLTEDSKHSQWKNERLSTPSKGRAP